MRTTIPTKAVVLGKAESELKEFIFLAGYLLIVFSALSFFKSAILKAEGIDWAPWGFAVIKAALAAKFILIGRALHIGEGHRTKPLIWQTLHKSIAFLVFIAFLTVIEEAIVGLIHGRTFWQSIVDIGGGTSEQLLATAVILLLVFFPLFAFGALAEVMGSKALVRTFFFERLEFEVMNRQPQKHGGAST